MPTKLATETKGTKQNAQAEKPAPEEKEQTPQEALLSHIKDDGIRPPEGMKVPELIDSLFSLQEGGIKEAKVLRGKTKQMAEARKAVAKTMLRMREIILRPDGNPDWAGATDTYKYAVGPILTAAHYDGDGDAQLTTSNALARAAQRLLPYYIAEFVSARLPEEMQLGDAEVERIVKSEAAVLEEIKGENADPRVVALVEGVNKQYHSQWAGKPERPRNVPASPFEVKESRTRTTPTGDEAEAAAEHKAAQAIVNQIAKRGVTLAVAAEVLWRALDAVYDRVTDKKDPRYGDEGKPVTLEFVQKSEVLCRFIGMKIDDRKLSKAEEQELTEARVQ